MRRLPAEDTTRREVLTAGLAVLGAAVAGPATAGEKDPAENQPAKQSLPAKLTPEAAHYQPTPHGWQKCLYCTYFQEPNTCGIVAGTVSPQGWCTHFALAHE